MNRLRHDAVAEAGGFALVGALFLLVVLAALGTYMVQISSTTHYAPLLAWQSAKAYHAARSGTEWGTARVLGLTACPPLPSVLSPGAGLNGGNLAGYKVVVTLEGCTTHRESGTTFRVYTISATAETADVAYGRSGYAMRRATATITDAP